MEELSLHLSHPGKRVSEHSRAFRERLQGEPGIGICLEGTEPFDVFFTHRLSLLRSQPSVPPQRLRGLEVEPRDLRRLGQRVCPLRWLWKQVEVVADEVLSVFGFRDRFQANAPAETKLDEAHARQVPAAKAVSLRPDQPPLGPVAQSLLRLSGVA